MVEWVVACYSRTFYKIERHYSVTCLGLAAGCHSCSPFQMLFSCLATGQKGRSHSGTSAWPLAHTVPGGPGAETIANTLVGGMISPSGGVESNHSDQGRPFESCVFATL